MSNMTINPEVFLKNSWDLRMHLCLRITHIGVFDYHTHLMKYSILNHFRSRMKFAYTQELRSCRWGLSDQLPVKAHFFPTPDF